MTSALSFTFLGLSITSSWGNGHATTYRGLIRELMRRGHHVTFLERATHWYRDNADLPNPDYCQTVLYDSLEELKRHARLLRRADVVIVGSYVPQGCEVASWALEQARGVSAFYDIDTPVTLAALERGACPYLTPELVPRFDLYLSFSGGPILDVLRQRFGARHAEALYCSVDPELYRPLPCKPVWDLGYLGTYSQDRQPQLERFMLQPARRRPELSFAVGGSQYPDHLSWPENVARLRHVPPQQHPRFYSSQSWTLNVTRRDMLAAGYSPSVRLFEAAACGVPIVSDRSPGIDRFFAPDSELLLVDDSEDVLKLLDTLGSAERAGIAERARQRVLRQHTALHRAQELEAYVHAARSRRQPSRASLTRGTSLRQPS